ncbi:MAG: S8 family peptidase [Afipia sp.]|jgi:hypothetical protein|nr:S8 family peptidase [Afipia sp.]
MSSPLQVVLNPQNFSEDRENPGGGGLRADFFNGDDASFVAHKKVILDQLGAAITELVKQTPTFGPVGFVKVILRRKAWAKSHRPLKALFADRKTPLVGGLDIGQLLVEATPEALTRVAAEVAAAEDVVAYKEDEETGKLKPNPTARRSETGAIERVELYGIADRRRFDLDQAVVWLSNPRTGGQYEVELFETPPATSNLDAAGTRRVLFQSFMQGLQLLGQGMSASLVQRRDVNESPMLTVRLEQSALPPRVQLTPEPDSRVREVALFDPSRDRHSRLLGFLERHPLVRRIELPGVITRSASQPRVRPGTFTMPDRGTGKSWPKVGVIDGGISDKALAPWIIGRWDLLADEDIDEVHGTFIGGILVAGSALNGPGVSADQDGTELFDIAVFPASDSAFATYHGDIAGFLNEVENAVVEARTRHGVRVFNFSLNVQNAVVPDHYSKVASRLDQIADKHDVLIFISAGNLQTFRPEWPAKADMALQMMAASQNDGILVPAESARNVSVGALNPHGMGSIVANAPAQYSRRGPGLRALVKPDFAHIGGAGSSAAGAGHGLYSVAPDGSCADGCGTSYAAPFLARQTALLDWQIEGDVSRETLTALLAHHARIPEPLSDASLNLIGRQLCGHGMPIGANDILAGDDHQITLVFATRLHRDKQMRFNFAWPSCLVDEEGKCRGAARLTLVASPPLDQRFGAEFVRINVEAALQQEQISKKGKVSWKGQLKPLYLPPSDADHPYEAERVEHGMKWSPIKVLGTSMPQGRGQSTNWRLMVSYLSRSDNQEMPKDGVPFTALLTISDIKKEEQVFTVMRQQLSANVQLADIRTAARVVSRV